MSALSFERGLKALPDYIIQYFQAFLSDEAHCDLLRNYLTHSGLVLEKSGYQLPISSISELEATIQLLQKNRQSQSHATDTVESSVKHAIV